MPPAEHTLQPLSQNKRRLFFFFLVLLFVLGVPVMVFYAIGYRFDIYGINNGISAVGGMYIESSDEEGQLYVDEQPVEDMRMFRSAAYVQNLQAGIHRVHVQSEGKHTWVKDLPVFSHLVTEAKSFNMPVVPQIRLIPETVHAQTGAEVFDAVVDSYFSFASNTPAIIQSTSSLPVPEIVNIEYTYVESLFASSSVQQEGFSFSDFSFTAELDVSASSTKVQDNTILSLKKGELYVTYVGKQQDIPYYYCVTYTNATTTTAQYGGHVFDAVQETLISEGVDIDMVASGTRLCRTFIQINRFGQQIKWFDFYPDNTDSVLVLLEDGLYMIEIDDRAWQNAQLLYPGEDLEVVLDGGRMYVHDRGYYLEVLTEIAEG